LVTFLKYFEKIIKIYSELKKGYIINLAITHFLSFVLKAPALVVACVDFNCVYGRI